MNTNVCQQKNITAVLKIRFLFLLIILLVACKVDDDRGFDTKALTNNLEIMANKLESTLALDKSYLPVFDVVSDFNADNTGHEKTTEQLQAAIDACSKVGSGRVFFPAGDYRTGTLILKSGVHLEFDEGAKIFGSTDPEDYPVKVPEYKSHTDYQVNKSLIYAENVENISLTGKGTIDFGGYSAIYDETGIDDLRRPYGIRMISCKNVYVNGLRLYNSPQWMQHYLNCENVMVENIFVSNHANKNNDGIDFDGVRNGYIRNCFIDSDDDAICLKSTGMSACENILIENCIVSSHCNGLKLGTETTGGFKNIIFRNCKIKQSITGKSHIHGVPSTRTAITMIITDGGRMENVWFDSIEATDCITPIFVTLGNRSRKHTQSAPTPGLGSIENITISNITATGAGPIPSSITGLNSAHMVKNLTLENIRIEVTNPQKFITEFSEEEFKKFKNGYPSPHSWSQIPGWGFFFRYIDKLKLKNIDLEVQLQNEDLSKPFIIEDCSDLKKTDITVNSTPLK